MLHFKKNGVGVNQSGKIPELLETDDFQTVTELLEYVWQTSYKLATLESVSQGCFLDSSSTYYITCGKV